MEQVSSITSVTATDFISKRSVAWICHASDGVSLGINGSLLFVSCSFWHAVQLFVNSSMSSLIFRPVYRFTCNHSLFYQFLGDLGVVVLGCHRSCSLE